MENKATRYLTRAAVFSVAVLIIKIEYPRATWATVSLLVTEDGEPRWVQRNELFYADPATDGDPQPAGQVDLYASDLCSPKKPVSLAFRRPTSAEAAAGIVRYVFSFSFSSLYAINY